MLVPPAQPGHERGEGRVKPPSLTKTTRSRPDSRRRRCSCATNGRRTSPSPKLAALATLSRRERGLRRACRVHAMHQERRQTSVRRALRPIRHVSTGRGRGAASAVPGGPRADTTVRRAVAGGSAGMTGANRSPNQQTTRGLRCQSVSAPPPSRSDRALARIMHEAGRPAGDARDPQSHRKSRWLLHFVRPTGPLHA